VVLPCVEEELMEEEQRCTAACRRIEVQPSELIGPDGLPVVRTLTITRVCDHRPPRVLLDAPRQMATYLSGDVGTVMVAFKVQCRDCRAMFGGLWMCESPPGWPVDFDAVRVQGARLLSADGCLEDADGWVCAPCRGELSDLRLLLTESMPPEVQEGWPF